MADLQTLESKLRNADRLARQGDAQAARDAEVIAAEIRRIMAEQDVPRTDDGMPEDMFFNPNTGQYTSRELLANAPSSRAEAAQTGGMRGLSFGLGDEILGAANAVIPGSGTMGQRYEFGREMTRAREEAGQRDFPLYSTGAEILGGATTALSYGLPAIAKRGIPGAMVAGGAVGGAEGTAYGFFTGEGGFNERLQNAIPSGLLGIGAGALAPVAIAGATRAGRGLLDVVGGGVDAAISRGSQSRADRALANTFGASGLSLGEVQDSLRAAQRAGQPEFVLGDALGTAGQRRLSGIVRSGGEASDEVAAALARRQSGQGERVAAFTADAFDASRSAEETLSSLRALRKAEADRLFTQAARDASPVDVRGAVEILDGRISQMTNSGIQPPEVVREMERIRNQLAGQTPQGERTTLSDYESVLAIYRSLRDDIDGFFTSSKGNIGEALKPVMNALEQSLAASSDGFRAAQRSYREASAVIDALEVGRKAARPQSRAVDNAATFSAMSPEELAAARTGYGDALLRRTEGTAGPMTNRARPLTSDKVAGDVQSLAINPDRFQGQIARENIMHETTNRALGGSRTADNLADISAVSASDMGAIVRALSGDLTGAAQQAAARFGNAFSGMNQGTRKILADALMANDTQALERALSRARTVQERNQVVTAMLRIHEIQSGRDGGVTSVPRSLGLLSE